MRTIFSVIVLLCFVGLSFAKDISCPEMYDASESDFNKNKNKCQDEFFNTSDMKSIMSKALYEELGGGYVFKKKNKLQKMKIKKNFEKIEITGSSKIVCMFNTKPIGYVGKRNSFYLDSETCFLRLYTIPGSKKISRIVLFDKKTKSFLATGPLSRIKE